MPHIKNALIRFRIIDKMLRNKYKPFPSKKDLREACEESLYGSVGGEHICDSTIEKDLFTMKMEHDAPIKYSKMERGYYYLDAVSYSKIFDLYTPKKGQTDELRGIKLNLRESCKIYLCQILRKPLSFKIENVYQPSSHRLDIAPPGDARLRCGLCLVRNQPCRSFLGP